MLETTRKRGASIVIYLIFGALIVIFVVNFGAQSAGSREGCHGESVKTIVTIDGTDYGENTWRWAFNMLNGQYEQKTTHALDGLIRRELLAQEAERRGMTVSDSAVDARIKAGWLEHLGVQFRGEKGEPITGKQIYFEQGQFFDYTLLQRFVDNAGISVGVFKRELAREMLADTMEKVIASGAHASRDEAYAEWRMEQDTATADAVVFKADDYAKKMILTDADVDRFLAGHEAEVKAKFDTDKPTYDAIGQQVHLRRVFVKKQPPKADASGAVPASTTDNKSPGSGSGSGSAAQAKPAEDPGQHLLELARNDIVAKKKTFAQVAGALDDDEMMRGKGGDLGWMPADALSLPSGALLDAGKQLKAGGDPSMVIATPDGFWLLVVDADRKGPLKYDDVKREIASQLAVETWSKEAARRDAIAALTAAKTSGKALTDLYELEEEPAQPGGNQITPEQLEQMLQDPNTPDQTKQMILQMLQQSQQGKTGMLDDGRMTIDVPASWTGDGDASASGDGSGSGSAAAAPADAAPTPAAAKVDLMKPTSDVLPKEASMDKPKLLRIGPMPRDKENVAQLGKSEELIKDLFDGLKEGQLADHIYEIKNANTVSTEYVVVQLTERGRADPADFEKNADAYVEQLRQRRSQALVTSWLTSRCNDLVNRKELSISNDVLVTKDDKGQPKQIKYGACGGL